MAATGCGSVQAHDFAGPIAEACEVFQVNNARRLAAFLAQYGHETGGFTQLVENLNYSRERLTEVAQAAKPGTRWRAVLPDVARLARNPQALAEAVYSGRNGNTEPGDGFKFRGRGLPHLTGRGNYERFTEGLAAKLGAAPDFTLHPDLLEHPRWAAMAGGYFWDAHRLNYDADLGAFDAITRTINGGQNGRMDRRERWARAREALAA